MERERRGKETRKGEEARREERRRRRRRRMRIDPALVSIRTQAHRLP